MNGLKNIFVLYLVGGLLFTWTANSFIFIDFKIHQESIAEEHCINKDKPEMNCDGKCYLKEQLSKVGPEEQHSTPLSPRYVDQEVDVFYDDHNVFTSIELDEKNTSNFTFQQQWTSDPHLSGIEKPPKGLYTPV